MACTTVSISTSPMMRERKTLLRSQSSKELCERSMIIKRSKSDSQIRCCSINPTERKLKTNHSIKIFPFGSIISNPIRSFHSEPDVHEEMNLVENSEEMDEEEEEEVEEEMQKDERVHWVDRILEIRSNWRNRQQREEQEGEGEEEQEDDEDEGGCEVEYLDDEMIFDQESFSKLLAKVPWSDTKLFSQLAFLCNMAYVIPEIKADDLRKHYNLHYVTSSLEKKMEASIKLKLEEDSIRVPISSTSGKTSSVKVMVLEPKKPTRTVAHDIAASAATYIQSHAKGILSLAQKSKTGNVNAEESVEGGGNKAGGVGGQSPSRVYNSEVAAHVAASTMTAVVAAKEAEKQEAARALQSLHSSPCEWFICDDPNTYTRCFVIQGSDSLASWQTNLFFEPCEFEDTDVLVHRGIYEAAKGIYEQFMPQILEHLKKYGERAKLRFTGHSLGGSLSLLVNLMLLTRDVVKSSTLVPVVTFGSPFVFCGGQRILEKLGLEESHIHSVMMHRDIVPRAFSCNYPNHVAQILKRLSGTFQSHPCLNKNKMLYTPLGQMFILQPDGKSSPPHPLLPAGRALYALDKSQSGYYAGLSSALRAFLNAPHPIETLSDPTAYGSDGTILRDHDSSNYLKAMNDILRHHTKSMVERSRREKMHHLLPLLTTQSAHHWSYEQSLEILGLMKNEVVTGV